MRGHFLLSQGSAVAGLVLLSACAALPPSAPLPAAPGTKPETTSSTRWWNFEYPRLLGPLDGEAEGRELLAQALASGRIQEAAVADAHWSSIGPGPMTTEWRTYIGRIDAVATHPTRPEVLFVGAPEGGIWRSLDDGERWTQVSAGQCSGTIQSLAIDPGNPDVIYAATGAVSSRPACGVLKSMDLGATWTRLPASAKTHGAGTYVSWTYKVLVLPPVSGQGPGELLIANDLGIFRSTNGGASFDQVLAPSPDVSVAPVLDMAGDATRTPSVIYASVLQFASGEASSLIYKSNDGGRTWAKASQGLPLAGIYLIRLAMAPSNPDRVLAVTTNRQSRVPRLFGTADGGANWTEIVPQGETLDCQCYYDLTIAFDPLDPDIVYFGGVPLYVSRDGGTTWSIVPDFQHPDFHALAFDSAGRLVVGNDGGIYRTRERRPDGSPTEWEDLNGNLRITEVYFVAEHPSDPGDLLVGTQDNGTARLQDAPRWEWIAGGDGAHPRIDFLDPSILYIGTQWWGGPFFYRSDDGGVTFQEKMEGIDLADRIAFFPPSAMSGLDSRTLVLATDRVYLSTDRGDRWMPISPRFTEAEYGLNSLAVSASAPPVIYASAQNHLWVSEDGGGTWAKRSQGLPQYGFLKHLEVDGENPRLAYATFTSSESGTVFRTSDGGAHWTDISSNLPKVPASSLIIQTWPGPRRLLVATDVGVFVSANEGQSWELMSQGLPEVPITDLAYSSGTETLVAATYGRGVYTLSCQPGPRSLCLDGGRFKVNAQWKTTDGRSGFAQAVPLTGDTGYFWFFSPDNVEVFVKVLDACGANGRRWVFAGGLTDVQVTFHVTDTETGLVQTYANPQGKAFQPIQDTGGFASSCQPALAASQATRTPEAPGRLGSPLGECSSGQPGVCLRGGRFRIEADWRTPQGQQGSGHAVGITSDTGYFWFFDDSNLELVVKVLDACTLNQRFWVFAGGLTNLEVRLRVTDTLTGQVREYLNPANRPFQPIQDTKAFATCP